MGLSESQTKKKILKAEEICVTAAQPYSSVYAASCDTLSPPWLFTGCKEGRSLGLCHSCFPDLCPATLSNEDFMLKKSYQIKNDPNFIRYMGKGWHPRSAPSALWLILQLGEYDSSSKGPGTWTLTGWHDPRESRIWNNYAYKRSFSCPSSDSIPILWRVIDSRTVGSIMNCIA